MSDIADVAISKTIKVIQDAAYMNINNLTMAQLDEIYQVTITRLQVIRANYWMKEDTRRKIR